MIAVGLAVTTGPPACEVTAVAKECDTRAVGAALGAGDENGKTLASDSELAVDVTLGPRDASAGDDDGREVVIALSEGDDHAPVHCDVDVGDLLTPAEPDQPGVPPDGEAEGVTLTAGDSPAGLGDDGDAPDHPGDAAADSEGGISEGEAQSAGAPQYRDMHWAGADVYRSCAPAKRRNTAIDCQLSSTLTRKTAGPSSTYR